MTEESLGLYLQAIETISQNRKWASGKTIELSSGKLNGREAKIWLKNEQGQIKFTLFLEGKPGSQQLLTRKYYTIVLGWFVPVSGWQIVTNEKEYLNWNYKVKQELAR